MAIMLFFHQHLFICDIFIVFFKYFNNGFSLHNDWKIWHIDRSVTIVVVLMHIVILYFFPIIAIMVAILMNTQKYVSPTNNLITFFPTWRFFPTCYGSHWCREWWELALVCTITQGNCIWRSGVHIYFWQTLWTLEDNSKCLLGVSPFLLLMVFKSQPHDCYLARIVG